MEAWPVALKSASSLTGSAWLKASFWALGMSAVLMAGIAMRSTRDPAREVVAQALITPVSEVASPVRAVMGNSITMAEMLVPAKVSLGVSPAGRRPFAGTNGPAAKLLNPTRSKKKGSSRWPANTLNGPVVVMIGAGAVAATEGGVTGPVMGSPRPVIVNVIGSPEKVKLTVASATRSPVLSTWMS